MDGRLTGRIIYTAVSILFIFLAVIPVIYIFAGSFWNGSEFTIEHYLKAWNSRTFLLLLKSCAIAFSVAAAATLTGGLIGYFFSRYDIPFVESFQLILLFPFFISPYYMAVAWRDILFYFSGNTLLLRSEPAVSAIFFMCCLPVAVLIFTAAFSNFNSRIEEAGILVTSRMKVLWSLLFPLVKPALFSSFILIFILTISEISVPSYYMVNLLPTEFFLKFSALYDYKGAAALASILCIICIGLLLTERTFLANASFLSFGRKDNAVKKERLYSWKYPLLVIVSAYIACTVVLPLAALALQASEERLPEYLRDKRFPGEYLPTDTEPGYTINYFLEGFDLLKPAIADSLLYALSGAILICLSGFIFAYYSERKKVKRMDYLSLMIFAIPSSLYGIALIKFFNRPSLELIYTSAWVILIGYWGKYLFIASRIIGNTIRRVPCSLEEAAQLTGAGVFSRIRYILLPLLWRGLFTAISVSFILCLSEMAVSIVVYPPGQALLPIQIATSMHSTSDNLISAMVFIVLVITFILLILLLLVQKFIFKKQIWDPSFSLKR